MTGGICHFLLLQGMICGSQLHDVHTLTLLVLQVDQSFVNSKQLDVLDVLTSVPDSMLGNFNY